MIIAQNKDKNINEQKEIFNYYLADIQKIPFKL